MFTVHRSTHNPILSPDIDNAFESFALYNGQPVAVGSYIDIVYRAQAQPERFEGGSFSLSSIGRARSKDGIHFSGRTELVIPEKPWERYGCEDPRVTKIDGKYFIFYTALSTFPFSAEGIKVGVAISKDLKTIDEKYLVTPFNAKAFSLFPEKINGKYVALLTVDTDRVPAKIAVATFDTLSDIWDHERWNEWYKKIDSHRLDIPKRSSDHLEVGAVPVKTDKGWLLIYSHIQKYFTEHKIFGIEAVLLDLKNPQKIIGQTRGPILIPEETYEKYGLVPNVIFPTGVLVSRKNLSIYYGATDTSLCVAHLSLPLLLESMLHPWKWDVTRLSKKPLLTPSRKKWESKAVFNPAAFELSGRTYILYRAMGEDNTSVIGMAISKDGKTIDERLPLPVYTPRAVFEEKRVPGGNSGCEDPRVTIIKDTIYMYYTAYNGVNAPAIAQTHISKKDFLARKWEAWSLPVLVTKDGLDDKDGCLHPEKVKGKYVLYHRVDHKICADFGGSPEFPERNTFVNTPVLSPRTGLWDSQKVGISVPPIKTKYGWLLFYHGIAEDGAYRVGAALLSLKDPMKVLARSVDYLFEPIREYEKHGVVNNVVFPCGATLKKGTVYLYYGAADAVVDVATIPLKRVLEGLGF